MTTAHLTPPTPAQSLAMLDLSPIPEGVGQAVPAVGPGAVDWCMTTHEGTTWRVHPDGTRRPWQADYGTTYYAPVQLPEGWEVNGITPPPEPDGWYGTLRCVIARRTTNDPLNPDRWAVWYIRPEGHCMHGGYYRDATGALNDFRDRARKETRRAVWVCPDCGAHRIGDGCEEDCPSRDE